MPNFRKRSSIYSDGSGLNFCCSGQVSYFWFGYGFGNFPLKIPNFSIFCPADQKNIIGSGQKVPGSQPGWAFLFTLGQKYVRVGSGPISNRMPQASFMQNH